MKQKRIKVGIWIRVSTGKQAEGDSPEIHEKRARAYAESKDWDVVTIYHLEGISGKSVSAKEETQRMLQDIANGTVDCVIFSKLARFARNTKELLEFADIFQACNASMVSLQESIDTSSASGRFFYTILAAMGQWEREETVERILASNRTRRSLGKMVGGMASYGFDIVDAKLVINPKEAPIRKLMYELFLEYKRYKMVAEELNKRGYRTRKGKAFEGNGIRRLLVNTDAKGIHRSNYRGVETNDNPTGLKPKEEWVFNPCPAIVSEDLWNSVNVIIDKKYEANKNTRPKNRKVNLFMGYLYCHNGHKMSVQSKSDKYSCTQCKIRIEKQDMEDVFVSRLKQFSTSKKDKYTYNRRTDELKYEKEQEIKTIKQKQIDVEKQMNQLLELHLKGKIHTDGFDLHYNPLFDQSKELKESLQEREAELNHIVYTKAHVKDVMKHSENLIEKWEKNGEI